MQLPRDKTQPDPLPTHHLMSPRSRLLSRASAKEQSVQVGPNNEVRSWDCSAETEGWKANGGRSRKKVASRRIWITELFSCSRFVPIQRLRLANFPLLQEFKGEALKMVPFWFSSDSSSELLPESTDGCVRGRESSFWFVIVPRIIHLLQRWLYTSHFSLTIQPNKAKFNGKAPHRLSRNFYNCNLWFDCFLICCRNWRWRNNWRNNGGHNLNAGSVTLRRNWNDRKINLRFQKLPIHFQ